MASIIITLNKLSRFLEVCIGGQKILGKVAFTYVWHYISRGFDVLRLC